jgi:hypothetical protein
MVREIKRVGGKLKLQGVYWDWSVIFYEVGFKEYRVEHYPAGTFRPHYITFNNYSDAHAHMLNIVKAYNKSVPIKAHKRGK